MPDLGKTQSDLWFWKLPVFLYSISTFLQFSRKISFRKAFSLGTKGVSRFEHADCKSLFFWIWNFWGVTMEWMSFLSSEARKHPQLICKNFAIFRVFPRCATTKVQWCIRRHPPNIEHTWTLRVDTVLGGGFKDCIFLNFMFTLILGASWFNLTSIFFQWVGSSTN